MCVNHKIRITSFLKSSLENHQKRKIYMYCCTSWLICSRDIFFFTTTMIYFENISFFHSGRHLKIKLFKTYSIFQKPNRYITSAISFQDPSSSQGMNKEVWIFFFGFPLSHDKRAKTKEIRLSLPYFFFIKWLALGKLNS